MIARAPARAWRRPATRSSAIVALPMDLGRPYDRPRPAMAGRRLRAACLVLRHGPDVRRIAGDHHLLSAGAARPAPDDPWEARRSVDPCGAPWTSRDSP